MTFLAKLQALATAWSDIATAMTDVNTQAPLVEAALNSLNTFLDSV